tara:strand:+ start:3686 stop:3898 length:213 start_codon:yes stop_codon:yes gene_type:complete
MPKFFIDNDGQGKAGYVTKRKYFGYYSLPLDLQLDMLWHDIDNGHISANTTAANTWYQTIKEIRDKFPKE